jgi:hypothetical protein
VGNCYRIISIKTLWWFILQLPYALFAQDWLGYHTSNYSGIHSVGYNPATLASNNYKIDVSLVAGHLHVANNFLSISPYALLSESKLADPQFKNLYLFPDFVHGYYHLIANVHIQAPAFMIQIGERNAIGFAPSVRAFANVDHLDRGMVRLLWEEFDHPPSFNQPQANSYFIAGANTWAQYGFTFARSFVYKKEQRLKGGITLKLLQGLGSAYVAARNYGFEALNPDSMNLSNIDLRMGYAQSIENNQYLDLNNGLSVGVDIGFTYEYIPGKYDKLGLLKRKTFKRTGGIWADDETPYAFRIGASLVDIGALSYNRSPDSRYVFINADSLPLSFFNGINSIPSANALLRNNFIQNGTGGTGFTMELPMHANLFADFRLPYQLGFNIAAMLPFFGGEENDNRNHQNFTLALTPRWEKKWFGAYMPLMFDDLSLIHWGLSLRAGPFVLGSGNIVSVLLTDRMPALNLHFGVRLIFPSFNESNSRPDCPAYKRKSTSTTKKKK